VVRAGLLALFAGALMLVAGLDPGAAAGIVLVPMLLMGCGIGALASQLGAVTVSAVPDEMSAEVGGLQNTVTNLGASLGTALVGSVLIASLTSSFLSGIQSNAAIPEQVKSQATVELAGGIPFISDTALRQALDEAGVRPETTDAVVQENSDARLTGLRAALSVVALFALAALFFSGRVPAEPVGAPAEPAAEAARPS
jgi:hypothetical protein